MKILFVFVRMLSHLPLRVLYVISDVLYLLVYYIVHYRRNLVFRQVKECFPEKTEKERKRIVKKFYKVFCDYIVEILKMNTISPEEMKQRVEFVGIDKMLDTLNHERKQFSFVYLGHYGNWEWLSSFPLWFPPEWTGSQIYHPLYNKYVDQYFLKQRGKYNGRCIPMKTTLRHILTMRREGKHEVIGFIADQSPKWEAMHHWTDFLNHKTSFFIGTEKIARQVDAALYYLNVTRPSRGYYRAELKLISLHPDEMDEFEATNRYAALLEEQINECPELWLWTHKRWKRTYEEWLKRKGEES